MNVVIFIISLKNNLTSRPRRSVNVYRREYDRLHTINRTGIAPKMDRSHRPAHTANRA